MQKLRILNSKEKKKLTAQMEGGLEATFRLEGFEVLKGQDEYFLSTRECLGLDLEGMRIDSIGLRMAVVGRNGTLPSIHALQLICQSPRKAIELDEEQARSFIRNMEIETQEQDGSYVVMYDQKPIDLGNVSQKKLKRRK